MFMDEGGVFTVWGSLGLMVFGGFHIERCMCRFIG